MTQSRPQFFILFDNVIRLGHELGKAIGPFPTMGHVEEFIAQEDWMHDKKFWIQSIISPFYSNQL